MTKSTTRQPLERNKDGKGSYALVNGLAMYYEIHGTGKPLVLLHGGLATIDVLGTTHFSLPARTDLLLPIITPFLDAPMPAEAKRDV